MSDKYNYKKWLIVLIILLLSVFSGFALVVIIIDPYFHYHKPLKSLEYELYNERYQNNGIVKNFDYDAIITGSSMTENFKASEFDDLFECRSVKIPFGGTTYKELGDNLKIAFKHNDGIKIVLMGLDYSHLLDSADAMNYQTKANPYYLYDDNLLNDCNYVLNMTAFRDAVRVLEYTRSGEISTSFDDYSFWNDWYTFGKEAILEEFKNETFEVATKDNNLTDEDKNNIEENFEKNVISVAREHPTCDFYFFITPYSSYYWYIFKATGNLNRQIDGEEYAIKFILDSGCANIHVFSFNNCFDITTNLDNYKDKAHYNAAINSYILNCIYNGQNELNEENYLKYIDEERQFYNFYDYSLLF